MKYNIISLNNDRLEYKNVIRERVQLEEVYIPSINGGTVDIAKELTRRMLYIKNGTSLNKGEIGIWLSVYDCWQYAAVNNTYLIVFEDDAIPAEDFTERITKYHADLSGDYGFVALWVPDNQRNDYLYNVVYNEDGHPLRVGHHLSEQTSLYNVGYPELAKCYQGYGNVATLYSPQGARRFLRLTKRQGIYTPVDCFLFQEAHAGRIEGYSPKPKHANLVSYDWKAITTIHTTEKIT